MKNIYNNLSSNALKINEICSPVIPLGMIRYEAIFDFLSEEPKVINIREKKNDTIECMEQIFRTRRWGNNTKSSSLSIFAIEREWNNGFYSNKICNGGMVVREVSWDMEADVDKIKNCSKIDRDKMLQDWPRVFSKNFWININDCKKIVDSIIDFDKIISNGIFLRNRKNTCKDWKDFEVRRLFNWGCIHNLWSPQKENVEVEKMIVKIERTIKNIIENINYSIYSMDLDYSIKPNIYKKIITGIS